MKKFLNKNICFLVIITQLLSSCLATRALWHSGVRSGTTGDEIRGFFIDKEKSRIVLVSWNGVRHYSLSDPEGKLVRVFELGRRSSEIEKDPNKRISIFFTNIQAKGSEMKGSIWISFKMNGLNDEEMKFLDELNENPRKTEGFFSDHRPITNSDPQYMITSTTRTPSSLETTTNLCSYEEPKYKQVPNVIFDKDGKYLQTLKEPKLQLISQPKPKSSNSPDCIPITTFNQPWQGVISEEYTTSEKATRVVATPFTLAVDTLLLPIIVPLFVYSLYKQSTTNYWCQGEFCGYDNKQGNPTSSTTSKTKPDSNQKLNHFKIVTETNY